MPSVTRREARHPRGQRLKTPLTPQVKPRLSISPSFRFSFLKTLKESAFDEAQEGTSSSPFCAAGAEVPRRTAVLPARRIGHAGPARSRQPKSGRVRSSFPGSIRRRRSGSPDADTRKARKRKLSIPGCHTRRPLCPAGVWRSRPRGHLASGPPRALAARSGGCRGRGGDALCPASPTRLRPCIARGAGPAAPAPCARLWPGARRYRASLSVLRAAFLTLHSDPKYEN